MPGSDVVVALSNFGSLSFQCCEMSSHASELLYSLLMPTFRTLESLLHFDTTYNSQPCKHATLWHSQHP